MGSKLTFLPSLTVAFKPTMIVSMIIILQTLILYLFKIKLQKLKKRQATSQPQRHAVKIYFSAIIVWSVHVLHITIALCDDSLFSDATYMMNICGKFN